MPVLLIHMPGREAMKYEMTEDQVTIGRERGNTITLTGDAGISRTHCRIRRSGGTFVVEDAGSANGTRLNGRDLGGSAVQLCSGDRIRIGSTEIVFDDPLSPRRSWLSRLFGALGARRGAAASSGEALTAADGTVFSEGFMKCGKCGAKTHIGARSPGQKVGCPRCRSVYVVPQR